MGNKPIALFKPLVSSHSKTSFTITSSVLVLLAAKNTCNSFSSPHTTQLQRPFTQNSLLQTNLKASNNPFTSLISDFSSSIMGKSSGPSGINSQFDSRIQSLTTSNSQTLHSWTTIREMLKSQQTSDTEKSFRENLKYGYGNGSPLHHVRLFDKSNKEEDVRVVFYRDSASWCPYCQKVWMTLEEKKIPYKIEKINMRCYGDKPREFTMMQPSGAIPVAKIDGVVYNQSNDIMYALETHFPQSKSILPSKNDVDEQRRAQSLLRLERTLFGAWMYWLTGNSFGGERNKEEFLSVLKDVEMELEIANKNNPNGKGFFLGDRVSIVDFMFAPFLERMAASLLFFKGYQMRTSPSQPTDFPFVNKWFDAMETLESYRLTKSDYYTHCWDLPPQLGGCTYEDAGKPYEDAINGFRNLNGVGGSWEFPLQEHNGGVEPEWTWCNEEGLAKREAVERVSFNAKNIVKFASRGAGKKGMPPVMAALSDPNAVGNEAVQVTVDTLLRVICIVMLDESQRIDMESFVKETASIIKKEAGNDMTTGVMNSLVYLRDRVGVPRDMRLPAAKLFRANLNWAIGILMDA